MFRGNLFLAMILTFVSKYNAYPSDLYDKIENGDIIDLRNVLMQISDLGLITCSLLSGLK